MEPVLKNGGLEYGGGLFLDNNKEVIKAESCERQFFFVLKIYH
jgi:hypothetical protein